MGTLEMKSGLWFRTPKGRSYLEDIGVYEIIIIKRILKMV
jgi:hypothetical protein